MYLLLYKNNNFINNIIIMAFYLKKFSTHAEYDAYINGSGAILPNVSVCTTEGDVHYNPSSPVPPTPQTATLTCVYVPTGGGSGSGSGSGSGGNSTQLFSSEFIESIESMTIDGNEQPSIVNAYDFEDTNEHTVTLNLKDGVTSIGDSAFSGCSGLTSCTIGSGVTSIGEWTFHDCSGLTNIVIPDSVTTIGTWAFNYCSSLTSIDIPDSVTSIGSWAFEGCKSLTSIDIPSGVTNIGSSAFRDCSGLTSIVSNPTTPPTLGETVFERVGENGILTVPSGSQDYCDWMTYLPSGWTIDGVTCGGSGSGA
jgi:hypothetical protein